MSRVSVECPVRKSFRCGSPCVTEKGVTDLGKAINNGDSGRSRQVAVQRIREKAGDIGCPKPVVNKAMHIIGA